MTLAPTQRLTGSAADGSSAAAASVTAVLFLRGPVEALAETLAALAAQTRRPDRLVVVDPGLDGNAVETVRTHGPLAEAVPVIRYVTMPGTAAIGEAVRTALREGTNPLAQTEPVELAALPERSELSSPPPLVVEHVWVLTSDCAPAPTALSRLLDAVRRSPSVAVAGPKLVQWDSPGALRAVGVQLTRAGRILPSPALGEPDQGQYDRRTDVLAVPARGMLVERSVCEKLGWFEEELGEFGAEVDFGWRAQQAGHRVVVVPRAVLRTGARDSHADAGLVTPQLRRQARRVALARCAWWSVPFLAAWVVVSSLVAGLALLAAKRPRAAWGELSDVGAVLTPHRVAPVRWRSRRTRRVRRRDLAGLFVPGRVVLRHTGDLIHDHVAFDPAARDEHGALVAVESGPVDDDAEDLNILGASWASRAVRNPGLIVVLASSLVAFLAARQLGGSVLDRFGNGMVGGELLGVRGDAWSAWHAWVDGWHGAGLGQASEQSPSLVVLAALAWVVAHLPGLPTPTSPLGAAVAVLVGLAMPASTMTAYLAARVVTHARWPRAVVAVGWGTSGVLATAVASGRLGAAVAAILLPAVGGGCVLAARRSGTTTATSATILAAAVLGAFAPLLLGVVLVGGLGIALFGRGAARLRGLAIAVGPLLLLGPWVVTVVERPALALTGPGLSVWGQSQGLPWQTALLDPGGPSGYPVLLGVPLVLAGVFGLVRGGRRGATSTVLGLLVLLGLGLALAAPRLQLGLVPADLPHAGAFVTAWTGQGMLLFLLALLTSALHGMPRAWVRPESGWADWVALARWPMAVAVVAGILGTMVWTGWHSPAGALSAWTDPRPAVAVDQAEGALGNRMLVLEPADSGLRYRLYGAEPGDVARVLPSTPSSRPDTTALDAVVAALFAQGGAPGQDTPARALADQGVGFVGLRTDSNDPRLRQLDATAGLTRLGEHAGVIFWRVSASGSRALGDAVAPSRARLVAGGSGEAVPVSGPHGQIDTDLVVPREATLILAEPPAWVRHARVSVDDRVLAPVGGQAAYRLPAGRGHLTVELVSTDALWRAAQGFLVLLVVFLAVPFGNRASRRRR